MKRSSRFVTAARILRCECAAPVGISARRFVGERILRRRSAPPVEARGRRDRHRGPVGRGAERGQAAVELVALLPIFVSVALAILQALAAGAAAELADHAAQTGAVAVAQGRDGAAAARAGVPGWARDRIDVSVRGTRVRVRLEPPALLPGLGDRLAAVAVADAGGAT